MIVTVREREARTSYRADGCGLNSNAFSCCFSQVSELNSAKFFSTGVGITGAGGGLQPPSGALKIGVIIVPAYELP